MENYLRRRLTLHTLVWLSNRVMETSPNLNATSPSAVTIVQVHAIFQECINISYSGTIAHVASISVFFLFMQHVTSEHVQITPRARIKAASPFHVLVTQGLEGQ